MKITKFMNDSYLISKYGDKCLFGSGQECVILNNILVPTTLVDCFGTRVSSKFMFVGYCLTDVGPLPWFTDEFPVPDKPFHPVVDKEFVCEWLERRRGIGL